MTLHELQERIRYPFGDPRLLLLALTHVSYGHENNLEKALDFLLNSVFFSAQEINFLNI